LNPGSNHFATFNLQPYPFVGCGVHIQTLPSLIEISSELWAKQMGFSGAIHKAVDYEFSKVATFSWEPTYKSHLYTRIATLYDDKTWVLYTFANEQMDQKV